MTYVNGFRLERVFASPIWFLTVLSVFGLCGAAYSSSDAPGARPDPPTKKVLLYGTDAPTPAEAQAQAARFDRSAFDAAVFRFSGPNLLFTHAPLAREAFEKDVADLQAFGARRLGDSFLRLQVNTEDGWDWSNDADWAALESNLRNYARLARQGGLRGILFDPEPYGFNVWNYETQPARGQRSFEALEALAERRGADFMNILKSEYPGIVVFSLKLFSQSAWALDDDPSHAEVREVVRNDTFHGLWYGFANGMISELDRDIVLIDGNEDSYYYLGAADFGEGKRSLYGKLATAFLKPANAARYRAQVTVAHAVYLDGILNLADSPRFFGYYLPDAAHRLDFLEHNVFYGLSGSDTYVWLYAEELRWWSREGVPAGFEPLVRRVKEKVAANRSLGFKTGFIGAARRAFDARVGINGTVSPNVPGLSFAVTGLPATACGTYNNGGKYTCTFPAGSTVTVTPVAEGVSFRPSAYAYTNISEDNRPDRPHNQDFRSR